MDLQDWLGRALAAVRDWQDSYGPFDRHWSLRVDQERFAATFEEFTCRLRENYPYFHLSYAGQMLKPPHPAAVAGDVAAMLINPNNHALDGGLATSRMEKEAVAQLAAMFGLGQHLGHLTSSGTIANLEALYVSREGHPDLGVAYSSEAHYTHGRMCGVLRVPGHVVPADGAGRMDAAALDALLARAVRHRGGHGRRHPGRRDRPGARRSCRWPAGYGPGARGRRLRGVLHPARRAP